MIDAKTGISGAGRGGADNRFGYAESNEKLVPYGPLKHVHMSAIAKTIEWLSGGSAGGLVFTPRLAALPRYVPRWADFGTCWHRVLSSEALRLTVKTAGQPLGRPAATTCNLPTVALDLP
ncbi:hypothetical protein [Methylobacterium sp. CM6257]